MQQDQKEYCKVIILEEIETKIINIDVEGFKKKIISLGAKPLFNGTTKSKAYKLGDSLIRLRDFGEGHVELTYKGPALKSKYKVREEITLMVDDFERAVQILNHIGLKGAITFNKDRESYALEVEGIKFHVDIDDYKVIPKFVEIETKTEEDLKFLLKYFGIDDKNTFAGSFKDLLALYNVETSKIYKNE